jgi:TP901 family phage tail tape measure protein
VEQTLGSARKAFGNVVSSATWQAAAVAAAGIGAGLGSAVRVAMDFEKAMSSVAAKSGAVGEEFQQLSTLAKDLGRTTKFTATEVAEGMDFLAMAGFKTNDILAAMPGILQLATAANADLAMTADIVSDTLGAMGLEADYTGRMADIMAAGMTNANFDMGMLGETMKNSASVAREFGMSFEELIAATDALAFGGIKGAEAGNALKRVMLLLAAPTDAAGKLLEQLGVSAADTEGNMRPLNEIFGDLGRAMDAAGMSEQQRLQTLETLFGKQAAVGAATLLNAEATGKWDQALKNAIESEGRAGRDGAADGRQPVWGIHSPSVGMARFSACLGR